MKHAIVHGVLISFLIRTPSEHQQRQLLGINLRHALSMNFGSPSTQHTYKATTLTALEQQIKTLIGQQLRRLMNTDSGHSFSLTFHIFYEAQLRLFCEFHGESAPTCATSVHKKTKTIRGFLQLFTPWSDLRQAGKRKRQVIEQKRLALRVDRRNLGRKSKRKIIKSLEECRSPVHGGVSADRFRERPMFRHRSRGLFVRRCSPMATRLLPRRPAPFLPDFPKPRPPAAWSVPQIGRQRRGKDRDRAECRRIVD